MEVSSHALSLHRADEIQFSAAVFSNLTRDHLDFHADMDEYFRAKRQLFEMLPPDAPALLNVDDPRGAALADAGGRPITYAINRPADITTGPLSFSLSGLSFDVRTPRGTLHVKSSLVGRPNVYNILAAVATGTALGLPFE
jgi:UDP-N-acetylmuramoyl-L-alanyl-D-glutamate--2,6-diaminopimelate ligase